MSTPTEPSSIHRLRLRLHCDQARARPLQQRVSRLFHHRLQSQLQALFARLQSRLGTRSLALDKLVLDLGPIAIDDFDSQFVNRLLVQLERRLLDLIASLPPSRQHATETLSVPRRQALGNVARAEGGAAGEDVSPTLAPGASIVTDAWPAVHALGTPVEAVAAYLQSGYWPSPALWRAGPGAWLRQRIDADDDWTPVLALCCSSPEPLRRLRGTFDLAAQGALQHAARAGWSPLEAQAAERWQRWRAAVQCGAADTELDRPAPRTSVRSGLPSDAPAAPVRAAIPSHVRPASSRASVPLDAAPADDSMRSLSGTPPAAAPGRTSSAAPPVAVVPGAATSVRDATVAIAIAIAVANAGLVLLWPMLARLFNQLQLLHESDFIDDDARAQAVCLLDWLLWDDAGPDGSPTAATDVTLEPEWRTPMSKLLCGWPPAQALPAWHRPDTGQRALLRTWMSSSLGLWPAMQRVGTTWARELFLRREGQVLCSPERIELVVARDASDALLHDLPWPLQEIDLPWMPTPLLVDWVDPASDWRDLSAASHPA